MTEDNGGAAGPGCGCGCCEPVLAELAALRDEVGQLAGLVIVAGIGADPAADDDGETTAGG